MVQNYMDYSDDTCMNLFTKCQVARMRQVLRNSPRRKELLNSPVLGDLQAYLTKVIKVYPNPVDNDLILESNNVPLLSYAIHDVLGRRLNGGILRQGRNTISLNFLAAGVYVMEIQTTEGKMTKKVVKR